MSNEIERIVKSYEDISKSKFWIYFWGTVVEEKIDDIKQQCATQPDEIKWRQLQGKYSVATMFKTLPEKAIEELRKQIEEPGVGESFI